LSTFSFLISLSFFTNSLLDLAWIAKPELLVGVLSRDPPSFAPLTLSIVAKMIYKEEKT
jgi:hypothetical protein